MFNRRFHRAWLNKPPQSRRKRRHNPAQMELNFCAEPFRPLTVLALAAELVDRDRPLTEEELAAEWERLIKST